MRNRHRDAGAQENKRVDSGQAPRRHRLERPTNRFWSSSWPYRFKPRPEQEVGEEVIALTGQPGNRIHARIEQRTKERGEEHHLRGDEPTHTLTERTVHLAVVHTAFALGDDLTEPAHNHPDDDRNAQDGHDSSEAPELHWYGRQAFHVQ